MSGDRGQDREPATWQGQGWGWVGVAAIALMTALPMSYYRMVAWPWIGIWQVGFLAVGIWGFWQLRQFQVPWRPLGYGLDWLVGLTLGIVAISGLAAEFPAVALWNVCLVLPYGLGLFVLVNWLASDGEAGGLTRQRLWSGLVMVAGSTAVISLALWRPTLAMWRSEQFSEALRNAQPFGHHNFVGGYCVLTLPLAIAYAVGHRGWRRWLGIGVALGVGVALYASGSRGAMLGAIAGFVWLVGANLGMAQGAARWRWLLLGGLGLGLGLLVALTNPRVQSWFTGWQGDPAAPSAPGVIWPRADGPTVDRGFMVQMGAGMVGDRPLVGVGPGNLGRVSNRYRPPEMGTGLDHIQQLHNTPVQLAAELGLGGLVVYGGWWWGLGRVVGKLRRWALEAGDRALLWGISGSFVAYGVSSLTDYQLENIGISSTLVVLVGLLLSLAQDTWPTAQAVSQGRRRLVSLGVLGGMGLCLGVWVPFDLSLAIGQTIPIAPGQGTAIALLEDRASRATAIAPWDPTFSALASQTFLELRAAFPEPQNQAFFHQRAIDYGRKAQAAAPHDVWFNHNLAVLSLGQDNPQAEFFAQRAVELLPRHASFGYFVLGWSQLLQGKTPEAIAALTLEALVRPEFLTYPLWQAPPFQSLWDAVTDQVLAAYEQILQSVPPQSAEFAALDEQQVLVRWWRGWPEPAGSPPVRRNLRPLVQALLWAEPQPERARAVLRQAIAAPETPPEALPGLHLLAAWLFSEADFLTTYATEQHLSPASQRVLQTALRQAPTLRTWLTALQRPVPKRTRAGLAYAYRNDSARRIRQILYPENLQTYAILSDLGVFLTHWPREFPPLDRYIDSTQNPITSHHPPTPRSKPLAWNEDANENDQAIEPLGSIPQKTSDSLTLNPNR